MGSGVESLWDKLEMGSGYRAYGTNCKCTHLSQLNSTTKTPWKTFC